MKKLFFLATCMLFSFYIQAQDDSAAALKALDSLLVDIDQSSVTTGIIYERTLQKANLYNYNREEKFNTAEYSYFRQSLLEMHRASNAKKFISLDSLEIKLESAYKNNIVEMGILNAQFNIINYNEDDPLKGGMTLDTIARKFKSIPDAEQFYMMHTIVIAPLMDAVAGKEINFRFTKNFFFTNGDKIIKKLEVDFGNGTVITIISDEIFNETEVKIPYETSGTKIIKFNIEYSDGSKMSTNGAIYFTNTALNLSSTISCGNVTATDYRQDFMGKQAEELFQGYRTTDPKIKPQIDYRIYYSAGNSQKLIKKPLIIIDGFDPGDKRKIEDCDCELDTSPNGCASLYRDDQGNFNPTKHKSIVDMMLYYEDNFPTPLLPLLRSEAHGFDVIIVNFPKYTTTNLLTGSSVAIDGGAYYIESNAMAVVKLLQEVKQQVAANGSTNQTAIIAPSMAGQISRYALSFMEKKFQETSDPIWQHNVSLWVSVDSPHLGANIPLGDQALIYLLRDEDDNANRFYNQELASPASQQQLIEFHKAGVEPNPLYPTFSSSPFITNYHTVDSSMLNAQTTTQGLALNRGNSFYQEHYNRQNSNGISGSIGWPQNLRKIAVVNGSLTGSKEAQTLEGQPSPFNFANDGATVLNIRGFQRIHINLLVGSITWRIHIASLEAKFMKRTGENGRISRFKKAFDDKTTQVTNINNRGVMDNIPGGYFDAQRQLYEPIDGTLPIDGSSIQIGSFNTYSLTNIMYYISQQFGGSEWQLRDYNPIHSFIPSFSAIAHLEPNQNWANPLNYNLACPTNRKTPFDSYFGIAKNTPHTSFTNECVKWLIEELDGNPQLPDYPMEFTNLDGPETICSLNTNTTYSFNDICRLPSYVESWYVGGNLQIINQNGTSITVKSVGNGPSTITAIFANGKTVTKDIWIGTLNFNSIVPLNNLTDIPPLNPNPSNGCQTIGFEVNFWPLDHQILEYQWEKITTDVGWQRDYMVDTSNKVYLYPTCNKNFMFKVRVRSACGWSNWFQLSYAINSCQQDCAIPFNGIVGNNFVLNPNPVTNGILNISIKYNAPWFVAYNNGGTPSLDPNANPVGGGGTTNMSPRVNISIFNQAGSQVASFPNMFMPAQLNLSNLPSGFYNVILSFGLLTETYTIIKQ
jgi:hypothetical protein